MTVYASSRSAGPFIGDGARRAFPFDFKVFAPADLRVDRTSTTGQRVTLAYGDDYTVTLGGYEDAVEGGFVTLVDTLPDGWKLDIRSAVSPDQQLRLEERGRWSPKAVERALDRLAMLYMQASASHRNGIRAADIGVLAELPDAAQRAKRLLAFDDDGQPTVIDPKSVASGTPADLLAVALAGAMLNTQTSTPADVTALTTAAILATVNAANRSASGVARDLTPPPTPGGVAVTGGVTSITATWAAPIYSVGHGHASTIVYAARWAAQTPPADLKPVWYGPGMQAQIPVDPGSKWRLRLTWVSADGIEGPMSAPVDVQADKIGSAAVAEDLLTARQISSDIATGALVNDPTFASGSDGWRGFVNRLASTAVGVPAPAPSAWVARFTGRDGYSKRTVAVVSGQEFRLTCYCNPLNSGAKVGVQIVTQSGTFYTSLATLAPNAWGRVTLDYTVPAGVTEIAVGPMIDQPDGGTLIAMFAHIELMRRMPYDLIVQGDVIADQVSAKTINAFQAALGRLTVDAARVMGRLEAAELVVGSVSLQRTLTFALYTQSLNINAAAHQHWSNSQVFDAPVGARLSFSVEDSFTVECGAMELAGGGVASEPASMYIDTDIKVFVDGAFVSIHSGLNDLLPVTSFHIGLDTGDLATAVVKGIKRTTSRTFLFTVPPEGAATSRSIQVQIQKTVSIFDSYARLLRTAGFATTNVRLRGLGTVQENKV